MIKIAICDDEKLYVDKISLCVQKVCSAYGKNHKVAKCYSGKELIELYQNEYFDAVFLDISMPGMNGFKTAEKLIEMRKNTVIIFVSSHDNMVYSSYEYRPFWFVPKIQISMLESVVKKLIEKIVSEENESRHICLQIESKKQIELDLKETAYFKTDDHYLQFVMKDLSVSKSYRNKLDNIEEQLKSFWFVRIHNRYLVNLKMISTIEKRECVLINGERIPVSRTNMAYTKEMFQEYMRSMR